MTTPTAAVLAGDPSESRRVLRVLSGLNAGAQCEVHEDRVLVGNIEGECDVVLDVTRPERHACLVRAAADGWTVLAIAGDLWVEREYVEPQQTCPIAPGLVITLGRVSFGLGHPDHVDWDAMAPYADLERPTPAGPVRQATLPAAPAPVAQRWRAVQLATGLGLGALVLSAAATYVSQALATSTPSDVEAQAALQADKAQVASLPWASEVTVSPHPDKPGRVLLEGYVQSQTQLAELSSRLHAVGAHPRAELRLAAVDALSADLLRRFELKDSPQKLRYVERGQFSLTTVQGEVPQRDRQARIVMQEMPHVRALALQVDEALDAQGKPLVVRYARSDERPGDLKIENLESATSLRRFVVVEMRLGTLPSVVLDSGGRYFTGAKLPDGSTLTAISAGRLVVASAQGVEQVVTLPEVPATREAAVRPDLRSQQPAQRN